MGVEFHFFFVISRKRTQTYHSLATSDSASGATWYPPWAKNWSLTWTGSPYCKSITQHWHAFFTLAHVWQISVVLYRLPVGLHLNTSNGLSQILHAFPNCCFIIRTYGLSPKQFSHKIGKLDASQLSYSYPLLIPYPEAMSLLFFWKKNCFCWFLCGQRNSETFSCHTSCVWIGWRRRVYSLHIESFWKEKRQHNHVQEKDKIKEWTGWTILCG